jgi:NAD(P)-dependent dehydrogenase (short-subunit alcohol dehydrogenase family)
MSNNPFEHLKNKVCVITGGSGIIGSALCQSMASAGINLAIIDINKPNTDLLADKLTKQFSIKALSFASDVLDKRAMEEVKIKINETLGEIDFLVNCAGGNSPDATTKLEEIPQNGDYAEQDSFFGLQAEGFDKTFALNFKGTLIPSMVFAKDMIKNKKGSIVNISSMSSTRPMTKVVAYSAAKAAINNFTHWLAVHFGSTGVRVNAMAPGFFLTNQNRFLLTDEITGKLTARGHKIINHTPMKRFGEVEDLTGTLLYLLSDLSNFVTGIIIPVDGGFSAYSGV